MKKNFPTIFSTKQYNISHTWPWYGEKIGSTNPPGDSLLWPKICVVMPSFNQAQYLEAAICSVLYQGYPNLDFIIMDGGSIDGSVEIIKKYENWLHYWQSSPDKGQYQAIQEGFSHSTSDVMTWINSDDLLLPWSLFTIGQVFTNLPQVQWIGSSIGAMTNNLSQNILFSDRHGISKRWFFENVDPSIKGSIQQEGTFWSRSLWEKAGSQFDSSLQFAADFELWARFWKYSPLTTISVPLGVFRKHDGQKSSQTTVYFSEAREVLKRYHLYPRISQRLLIFIANILNNLNSSINWFQLKCQRADFDIISNDWQLKCYY